MRRLIFNLHLYVGLAAAAFLVVAGVTGSFLAFENDYDRWLHPSLWSVTAATAPLPEQKLVDAVAAQFAPQDSAVRVEQIALYGPRTAQVFVLSTGRRIFVNPYSGEILGMRDRPSRVEMFVVGVHQLHVQLLAGNAGRRIVDIATMTILFLVPTGLYLWWPKKRVKVRLRSSWRRFNWDLHNVAGLYGFVLVFVLAVTGLLLSFETPLYWLSRSDPWRQGAMPRSVVQQSAVAPDLDQLIAEADRALPGADTYEIHLPMRPRSPVQVLKHGPGPAGRSTVFLDRYSGRVLRVDDASKLPRSYRAHLIDQAIHMGTIMGMTSKIAMSAASLVLVILVITGTTLWWQKWRLAPTG